MYKWIFFLLKQQITPKNVKNLTKSWAHSNPMTEGPFVCQLRISGFYLGDNGYLAFSSFCF